VLNGKHQVLETDTGEVLERRDDPKAPFFADLDARGSERPRFTRHRRARKSYQRRLHRRSTGVESRCDGPGGGVPAGHRGRPGRALRAPAQRRNIDPGTHWRRRHAERAVRTPSGPASDRQEAISNSRPAGDADAPPRTTLRLGTGKQSSGRTGPASSKPQPMSELRNHPRKLTPNSQPSPEQDNHPPLSRPSEDCEGCPPLAGFAIWSGRSQSRSSRFTLQFRWRGTLERAKSLGNSRIGVRG